MKLLSRFVGLSLLLVCVLGFCSLELLSVPSSWVEKPKEGVVLENDLATCQAAEAGGWRVGGQRGLIANYI